MMVVEPARPRLLFSSATMVRLSASGRLKNLLHCSKVSSMRHSLMPWPLTAYALVSEGHNAASVLALTSELGGHKISVFTVKEARVQTCAADLCCRGRLWL